MRDKMKIRKKFDSAKEFAIEKSQPLVTKLKNKPPFHLSWSHYLLLMRIENMKEIFVKSK